MKGEIFNLLEKFVVDQWGEDIYEGIFEEASLRFITKEPFVGPGTYPDQDFLILLQTTIRHLKVDMRTAQFEFGRYCFPRLVGKVATQVADCRTPKEFLMIVDRVVHLEARKLYPGCETPEFTYEDTGANALVMTYRSKRRMFDLVEGFIQGCSEYYEIPISCERKEHEADPQGICEFHLRFGEQV